MISSGLSIYCGKRVLLLQGPVGPFFSRLGKDLTAAGAHVFKVNFNGGDWFFYRDNAIAFRGTLANWPSFFLKLVGDLSIDSVILFGDCRAYHTQAHAISSSLGLDVAVFEEGYLRPNHITMEREGVNGHSELPTNPIFYLNSPSAKYVSAIPIDEVGNTFWYTTAWACLYYIAAHFLRMFFPHYEHHRPLTVLESRYWARSVYRKWLYRHRQRGIESYLVEGQFKNFFLVPLQVHNDSQINVHSGFASVPDFLRHVVESFAYHAPAGTVLVFKHHPMDRGYCNYAMLLKRLGDEFGLGERLLYIHDQHLPSLLQAARGVVLVNSTVGLSALHHKAPLKVCGDSIYSIKGLVYQKSLDTFWADSKNFRINEVLLKRFLNYIIERTQVNGSFYKRLPIPGSTSGMRWDGRRGIEAWGRHIEGGVETAQRNRRSSDRRPNKYKLPETNHVERIPSKPRKAAN